MNSAPGTQMAAEIAETPAVVQRLLDDASGWAGAAAEVLGSARGVGVIARGSSDHAGAYGRYVLEQALGVPCWTTTPSLVTRFGAPMHLDGVVAVAISQSGRTPEIVASAEGFRAAGARVIAITNDVDSPLAEVGEVVIGLQAGEEFAVPATKTFTATVAAFAALAARCGDRFPLDAGRVVEALDAAVHSPAVVDAAVAALAGDEVLVHLGRGYLLPLATEAALKIIETSCTANLVWSTVDVCHGPMAMLGEGRAVVVHAVPGTVFHDAASIVTTLVQRRARVVTVGSAAVSAAGAAAGAGAGAVGPHVSVPGDLAEHLEPIVHAVRVQQLAHGLALARGMNPDQPSGLNKVTATT